MKNKYQSLTEFIEANNLIEDKTIISFLANNVVATAYYQGCDIGLFYFGLSPYSNGAATGIAKVEKFEIVGGDTWHRERFTAVM